MGTGWNEGMRDLLARAEACWRQGLSPDSSEVQALVDEWVSHFANAMQTEVTPAFLTRFTEYVRQVEREPNQRLWDIFCRLNPERMRPAYEA
jgi:hypothetical protein